MHKHNAATRLKYLIHSLSIFGVENEYTSALFKLRPLEIKMHFASKIGWQDNKLLQDIEGVERPNCMKTENKYALQQCFSTGEPQRSLSGTAKLFSFCFKP
jgi:hypothetical protein